MYYKRVIFVGMYRFCQHSGRVYSTCIMTAGMLANNASDSIVPSLSLKFYIACTIKHCLMILFFFGLHSSATQILPSTCTPQALQHWMRSRITKAYRALSISPPDGCLRWSGRSTKKRILFSYLAKYDIAMQLASLHSGHGCLFNQMGLFWSHTAPAWLD